MLDMKKEGRYLDLLKKFSLRLTEDEVKKMDVSELKEVEELFELRDERFGSSERTEMSDEDFFYEWLRYEVVQPMIKSSENQ